MVYTLPFFFSLSSKCSLFHNSNVFGSCIIHILYTGCANFKKKIRRQKVKGTLVNLGDLSVGRVVYMGRLKMQSEF